MRFKMGWSKASTSAFLSKAEIATWKTWRLKLRSSRVGRLAIHAFAENQLRRTHHNTPYQEAGAANSRHTTNLHDNSISCHILLLGTWIMMMLILNLWACRTWYQSYTHLRSHFNRNWCAFSNLEGYLPEVRTEITVRARQLTSYNFFWRPLDSIGKRLNIRNNLKDLSGVRVTM